MREGDNKKIVNNKLPNSKLRQPEIRRFPRLQNHSFEDFHFLTEEDLT